jgi:hypothetical protein
MNQLLSVLQSTAVSFSAAPWTMNQFFSQLMSVLQSLIEQWISCCQLFSQLLSVLQSAAVSSSVSCCQFFSRSLHNESAAVSSSVSCCQFFSRSLNNESSAISPSAGHSARFQSLLTAVLSNQQTKSSQSDRPPFQPTLLPPVTSLYRLKWRHSTLTTLVFLTTHAQCRNFVDQIRNIPTKAKQRVLVQSLLCTNA